MIEDLIKGWTFWGKRDQKQKSTEKKKKGTDEKNPNPTPGK